MKKSIVVLLLLIIISFLPNACKKEKNIGSENTDPKVEVINVDNKEKSGSENEHSVDENIESVPIDQKEVTTQCSNGYLFKASYSDKTQIKRYNFETMKEEIIGEAYGILSPDKKKVVFKAAPDKKNFNAEFRNSISFDLFLMNADGSDIRNISFDMKIVIGLEGNDFTLLFTPDSQEIIVSNSHWPDFPEAAIYIVNLAQNTCTKYDEKNPLFKPMRSYVDQQRDYNNGENTSSIQSNGDDYLVWFSTVYENWWESELGTFNWERKEYNKILSSPIPETEIISALWSPDFSKFILKVRDDNPTSNHLYHLSLYDISKKRSIKIADLSDGWYEYCTMYCTMDNWQYLLFFSDNKLWSYHIENQKETEIMPFNDSYSLFPLDETRCVIQGNQTDIYLFTSSDHSVEKLSIPEHSSHFVMLGNHLFFNTEKEIALYDLLSKTYQALYSIEYPRVFYLSDKQLYCFLEDNYEHYYENYYDNLDHDYISTYNMFILNQEGYQIAKIKDIYGVPFPEFYDKTASGIHSDDFYYFTRQQQPSDLYYAKSIQDKPINLTKGQYHIFRSELSPDQQNIAFYSLDPSTFIASTHLINLKAPDKVTTLASFQLYYHENSTHHEEYPYEHFLTLSWSKDSQWIYFVTRDSSKRFMIYRAKADGTDLTLLSDPKSSSFGSMASPDGKQLVYVTSEERKIALMNADGTNKKMISDGIATQKCYFPAWSPDGKMIAFNQLMVEDRYDPKSPTNQIIIVTPQGKIIKKMILY